MNVLYHFRTQGRGAEGVHIAGVANAFESMGHQLVFSNPSGRDPRKPVENDASTGSARAGLLRRFASRAPGVAFEAAEIGYNAASLAANARKIRTHGIDFIYERHAFFLCSTAGLAKAFDIPLVVEVNELVGDDRVRAQPALAPLARLADRVTFSRADVIVVVSPHLKRRMIEMGVEGDKILVQPNGVPASEVAAAETGGTRGAAVRARYGLEGEIVIGFVGLFLDWHRLDWMVEAFASLRPAERGITLMMVGDGPSESFAEVGRRLGVDAKILEQLGAGAGQDRRTAERCASRATDRGRQALVAGERRQGIDGCLIDVAGAGHDATECIGSSRAHRLTGLGTVHDHNDAGQVAITTGAAERDQGRNCDGVVGALSRLNQVAGGTADRERSGVEVGNRLCGGGGGDLGFHARAARADTLEHLRDATGEALDGDRRLEVLIDASAVDLLRTSRVLRDQDDLHLREVRAVLAELEHAIDQHRL